MAFDLFTKRCPYGRILSRLETCHECLSAKRARAIAKAGSKHVREPMPPEARPATNATHRAIAVGIVISGGGGGGSSITDPVGLVSAGGAVKTWSADYPFADKASIFHAPDTIYRVRGSRWLLRLRLGEGSPYPQVLSPLLEVLPKLTKLMLDANTWGGDGPVGRICRCAAWLSRTAHQLDTLDTHDNVGQELVSLRWHIGAGAIFIMPTLMTGTVRLMSGAVAVSGSANTMLTQPGASVRVYSEFVVRDIAGGSTIEVVDYTKEDDVLW